MAMRGTGGAFLVLAPDWRDGVDCDSIF